MPGLERMQSLDSNIDAVSRKVRDLRAQRSTTLDAALNVVDDGGRAASCDVGFSFDSLVGELATQGAALHNLDRSHLVELLSDPFEE